MPDAPLHVAVTVPWPEKLGGAEMMLYTLLKHADRSRMRATVIFLEPGPFMDDVAALGVNTVAAPMGRLREPRNVGRTVRRLAGVLRRENPDVLLNWAAKAQIYGASAAALSGDANHVAWWQHGVPDGHWLDRLATRLPARVIGCSSAAAAAAQRTLRPPRNVRVVHPGVETERVAPVSPADLGIPDGRAIMGIAGRLQPWKGQHRFIEALALLRDQGMDVHGLIVGGDAHGLSPEYLPELEELIDRRHLRDRITLTGHVPDARPYMAAMDVLVSASYAEPFGIVLVEGLAQGVPVVAPRDAGPAEIVESGVTGNLVAAPDPELLADAVFHVLSDPERRAAMCDAARRQAVERFSVAAMVEGIDAMLRSVARS